MFLCVEGNHYRISDQAGGQVLAEIPGPSIQEEGQTLSAEAAGFRYYDSILSEKDGLFCLRRRLENLSGRVRTFKMITRLLTQFVPAKYTMPCICYDGNAWGDGNSPKGLCYEGKPWVFAYDRMGIPSCTVTENASVGVALFASDVDAQSLRTSASMIQRDDGAFEQQIWYPVTEAPVTYGKKNAMSGRYDEFLTLADGEAFTVIYYVFACRPKWENFACANLLDRMQEVFPYRKAPRFTPERVWELGVSYLKRLLVPWHGKPMFIAGIDTKLSHLQAGHMGAKMSPDEMRALMKDPEYNTFGFNRVIFEIGWAGQGFLSVRLMMKDAIAHHDDETLQMLIGIQERWAEKQQENGMILPHFERYDDYDPAKIAKAALCQGYAPETCNLGWGASEMAKIYALLRDNGIEKPEFLRFSTRICDFFCAHYSPETGFGKLWSMEGEALETTGSVGGFIINGLLDTWRVTRREEYLATAAKALDFYFERDVNHFVCTAGAIDCVAVDKETSFPFVISSLDLFEITKEEKYLVYAQKAAYYFFSWAFQYDALYPDTSDFAKYGYSTQGGTAISAEHHAIDPWGALLVPEFIRLGKYTGDEKWITRARMMWNQSLLGIASYEGEKFHGLARPLGSQNEGFFQARWTKYRPDCEERGHFNDWLVSWVSAYRLTALDRLTGACGEKDWSMLDV